MDVPLVWAIKIRLLATRKRNEQTMKPVDYLAHLQNRTVASPIENLNGRIIRGQKESHFFTLGGDDPSREIVFLTNSDGLSGIAEKFAAAESPGRATYDALLQIGYDKDYIETLAAKTGNWQDGYNGSRYMMIAFPADSAFPATWDGTLACCKKVWPETARFCDTYASVLKSNKPIGYYEKYAGYKFLLTEKKAEDGGRPDLKMTVEKFLAAPTFYNFRLFLYTKMHCRETYSGDGFSYDNDGNKLGEEFLMPNMNISDIQGALSHQLPDISIPS